MEEKQEILQSKMLAKAVITSDADVSIVAVFEKSTQRLCFFVFSAPKANAPQSQWTYQYASTSYNFRGTMSLDDMVMSEKASNFRGRICRVKVEYLIPREEFEGAFDRIAHPMKYVKKQPIPAGATFDLVEKKFRRAAFGGGYWFNKRNRAFDSLPKPTNEVLVYADMCSECGKHHRIAHWPSGQTTCADQSALMKHPALEYSGHRDSMFVFKYRAAVTAGGA